MSDDGFLIEGRRYPMPDIGTFTMKECKIFTRLTGLTLEAVTMGMVDGSITFVSLLKDNAGFTPAVVEIAYRREHPDLPDDEVEEVIDRTNRMEMFMAFFDSAEDEPDPPSSGATSAPPESSPNNSSKPEDSAEQTSSISGPISTPSSERQDGPNGNTGTTGSDTSPMSGLERLAT